MSNEDKKLAMDWYCNKGFDLVTIGQHFGLSYEEIKAELNKL